MHWWWEPDPYRYQPSQAKQSAIRTLYRSTEEFRKKVLTKGVPSRAPPKNSLLLPLLLLCRTVQYFYLGFSRYLHYYYFSCTHHLSSSYSNWRCYGRTPCCCWCCLSFPALPWGKHSAEQHTQKMEEEAKNRIIRGLEEGGLQYLLLRFNTLQKAFCLLCRYRYNWQIGNTSKLNIGMFFMQGSFKCSGPCMESTFAWGFLFCLIITYDWVATATWEGKKERKKATILAATQAMLPPPPPLAYYCTQHGMGVKHASSLHPQASRIFLLLAD